MEITTEIKAKVFAQYLVMLKNLKLNKRFKRLMKHKIAVIGHIDHGKTTLSHAVEVVVHKQKEELKTIQQVLEEANATKIIKPYQYELTGIETVKYGKEKRKQERMSKS